LRRSGAGTTGGDDLMPGKKLGIIRNAEQYEGLRGKGCPRERAAKNRQFAQRVEARWQEVRCKAEGEEVLAASGGDADGSGN
jgi:hypothetical protein